MLVFTRAIDRVENLLPTTRVTERNDRFGPSRRAPRINVPTARYKLRPGAEPESPRFAEIVKLPVKLALVSSANANRWAVPTM
jgi:hypothetical protein